MNSEIQNEPANDQPAPVKPRASTGKIVARVIGFSCLSTLIIPIWIISQIISYSNNLNAQVNPEPDPSVVALSPMATEYKAQVTEKASMLSSFNEPTVAAFNRGIPCPTEDQSPDSCLMFSTDEFEERQDAKICAEVLTFAKELGFSHDSIPGDTQMQKLSGKSQARCETVMTSYPRSVGWGWLSPAYYLQGTASNGAPIALQLTGGQMSAVDYSEALPEPNTDTSKLAAEKYQYDVITSTNYDFPDPIDTIPDYTDSKIQLAALLDTFAYYRRSNPELPVFNADFARNMIADYKLKFRFDGKVEALVDSMGEVHMVHFVDPDKFEACVSVGANEKEFIKEFPEEIELGMAESGLPGGAVELGGVGTNVASLKARPTFGNYMLGSCK
ncbi:MAG: hypothetical protein NTW23_01095 [Rhodoluna sp.]|nr:hypothetical protein [Rhodoluna sp.]